MLWAGLVDEGMRTVTAESQYVHNYRTILANLAAWGRKLQDRQEPILTTNSPKRFDGFN
jgi:hypothetical protein